MTNSTQAALGSTGDIEQTNRVVSVNGMHIFTGNGSPSSTGNWHSGDLYIDTSTATNRIWTFNNNAWVQFIPVQYFFSSNGNITAGATQFFTFKLSSTESVVQLPISQPITLSKLYVWLSSAVSGATESITVTLRKNAADTSVLTTITSGGTNGDDILHTVSLVAWDFIDLKVVSSAGAGTPTINVSIG